MELKELLEELPEIIKIMANADEFKPLATQIIKIAESYLSELKEPLRSMSVWLREGRIAGVEQYKKAGFTKKEAIYMTACDVTAMREFSRNMNNGKKK